MGNFDKALADYDLALQRDPNSEAAYRAMAWIESTCPDAKFRNGKRALIDAQHAYRLSNEKDPWAMDVLAVAYAENGDYQQAAEWEKKAISLLTDDADKQ